MKSKKLLFFLQILFVSYAFCNNSPKFENIKSYNAPARIDVQASWNFIISAGFIYWTPKQVGLDLGILDSTDLNLHADKVIDFDSDFYPGFTVLLGTYFHYDNWNADIKYTRFHAGEKETQTPNEWSNGIVFSPYSEESYFSFIKTKWKPQLDFFDLTVGRPYYNGKNLTIKPNVAARGGWSKQSYRIEGFVDEVFRHTKLKSKSWFLGPQLSADLNWLISYGFRIFVNSNISLLYQKFENEYLFVIYSDPKTIQRDLTADTIQLTPNLDMKCGLGWSSYLDHHNWHIDLLITYDFLYFWNQNESLGIQEFRDYLNYHATGDLMLHGIEISFKMDF